MSEEKATPGVRKCPVCSREFEVAEEEFRKLVRCPGCGVLVGGSRPPGERVRWRPPESIGKRLATLTMLVLGVNAVPVALSFLGTLLDLALPVHSLLMLVRFIVEGYVLLIGLPTTVIALVIMAVLRPKRRWLWASGPVLLLACAAGSYWLSSSLRSRAFHRAVAGTTRLRARTGGGCHRRPEKEETLIEVTRPDEIQRIVRRIRVQGGFPGVNMGCMCCGDPTLEFYEGDRLIAMVSVHHEKNLRWHGGSWNCDASLTWRSATFLNKWLEDKGATGEQR